MTVPAPRPLERGARARTRTRMLEAASAAAVAAFALALIGGAAACTGSRGAPVQAPVELAIAPIGSLPDGGIQTNGEPASGRCALRLVATRIEKSSPGCYLDEHINKVPGVLHYPCGGDGPVEADFGDNRYTGRMTGGDVELELTGELDWEDGCHWGTRAAITGRLVSNGEPTRKKLSWQYKDYVINGSDCSGVCTARATIDVMSVKGRAPELPAGDDEEEED